MSGPIQRLSAAWEGAREAVLVWWADQSAVGRVVAIGSSGIVAGAVLGVGVVLSAASGGAGEAAVRVETTPSTATETVVTSSPSPSSTAFPAPSYTGERLADVEDEPTAEPTPAIPTVTDLDTLVSEHGEAPGVGFARLRIPSLGVDAGVGTRAVGQDGRMDVPLGPSDAVWYDMSAWPGLGGAPGSGGNAIFSGHVDYADYVPYAGVNYNGVGVFYSLGQLSPGDIIEVDINGETLRYAVEWRQEVEAATANWSDIFSSNVARDSITLVTCGGEFDFTSRSYASRTVVRGIRL